MGNQECICCEQNPQISKKDLPQATVTASTESLSISPLPLPVAEHLNKYKPYQAQLAKKEKRKRFGKEVYQGFLDHRNKPDGYGIMYYRNGSVFIGQFTSGIANGFGHYVFADGSYYDGDMVNNRAETNEGEFYSDQLIYKGGFKNNMFEGKCQQKGRFHQFKGHYHEHKKQAGVLKWVQNQYNHLGQIAMQKDFTYEGSFDDDGLFSGEGRLSNQYGEYKGHFNKGIKQGKGTFEYKSGLKYIGDYNHIKQGIGTVYTKSGSIAFSGQWRNGLPNGKGFVVNSFGDKVKLIWSHGIDERLLEKTQKTTQ